MVRQIHEWSWKLVQDRHFETEAKTKTTKNRSRDQDRGLEDYKTDLLYKLAHHCKNI